MNGNISTSAVTVVGGTLSGNGTLGGIVSVQSSGTLSPGASIGRLAIYTLTLQSGSTNIMEINKAVGTNDNIVGLTNLTYGGTLVIVTNGATPLAAGDSIKLYDATPGAYAGAFDAIVPATPGAGLVWNTSSLTVDGTLNVSAVTVLSGGSAGGSGRFGNGLTAQRGGSVIAGDGIGTPGTLIITNGLTEIGSVINRFDLSDDPTALVKTNDQIRVIGNLNLSGVNTIQVNLLNGPLANGDYVLFTYSGTLSGSLANLDVVGANGVLTNPVGQIVLHVDNTRAPASLVWVGGLGGNTWDVGTNGNWLNGALLDFFYFGDTVRFDNSGGESCRLAHARFADRGLDE